MGPLLAWLPFLVAIVLAFSAGVVFARMNELSAITAEEPRPRGVFRLARADVALTTALVALLVGVALVWVVAVVQFVRHG